MADRIVLDAHVVLAFPGGEGGVVEVEEILRTGKRWMTPIHLGEVACILEGNADAGAADEIRKEGRAESRPGGVPVRAIDIDESHRPGGYV